MKTSSSFKLNRSAKRMLALTYSKDKANVFKSTFIDAQLAEEAAKARRIKGSEENS